MCDDALRRRRVLGLAGVLLLAAASQGEPYWIAWEGDDWPENQGWTHVARNHFGGPLATRVLQDGYMEIDGLASAGISDTYYMGCPECVALNDGEMFRLQWRLKVLDVEGAGGTDPSISFFTGTGVAIGFSFAKNHLVSVLEGYARVDFIPHLWHQFELRSPDLLSYELSIDGQLVRNGVFGASSFTGPRVGWGDGAVGVASRSVWDCVRFGVVPETGTAIGLVIMCACLTAGRTCRTNVSIVWRIMHVN